MKLFNYSLLGGAHKVLFLFLAMFFLSSGLYSCSDKEEVTPADSVVEGAPTAIFVFKDMAAGFNLGNVFDNGLHPSTPSIQKSIIDLYHGAGMKHVRIPVSWMDRFQSKGGNLADDNGNIDQNHARLLDLKEVIDYALSKDMYVVINTHHEVWLKDHYDGSAAMDAKFSNLWTNIATYFKDYDYHLIFEVLNEPEGELGQWVGSTSTETWPSPTSSIALTYTRKVNQVGYDAIRALGGNNATRIVMVSPNGQGTEAQIEEVYPSKSTLPGAGNDKYIGIQVHSYNPWGFCGQTGRNSAYPGNASIQGAIHTVSKHATLLNVPVNYGEFGVGREDGTSSERNTDLVRGYYKVFAQKALSVNMSISVWDDRGWFGLVSQNGSTFTFTNNIVPYMLQK